MVTFVLAGHGQAARSADLAPDGVRVVDAPVSGGVPRAVTGELLLMVGGEDADVARAQPVLRVLGDPARQFRAGGLRWLAMKFFSELGHFR